MHSKSFDDTLRTRANFVSSVGLEMSEEDKNLSYLYWTPKLHKTPLNIVLLLGPVSAQLKTYHAFSQSYYPPLKME